MSRALTRIAKSLSLGLLMAFVVLVAAHATSYANVSAAPSERFAGEVLFKKFPAVVVDSLCHHKAPNKRHCRHAGRATATAIEPGTKRKAAKQTSRATSLPTLPSAARSARLRPDALHLRLSYGAVYAATRRMRI